MAISPSALSIKSEFIESYDKYISIGMETITDTNILYTGIIRNAESVLDNNLNYIYKHKKIFKNLDIFIYENDSTDNTTSILEKHKQNNNLHYISETLNTRQYGSVKSRDRIQLLSNYRNKSLVKIKELIANKIIVMPDYIVVIDLDFQNFNNEGILHSIGWMKENPTTKACAGMSLQSKLLGNYPITWNYDCWAFRLNWWSDLQDYNNNTHQDLMYWFGMWVPPIGSDPLRVNSAFGGSCIYNSTYYLQGQYDAYDCEHVCFHKYLYDNFTDFELRFNPAQVMIFD